MDNEYSSPEYQEPPDRPPKLSGLAVASLILSLTIVGAPLGIIFGHLARVRIHGNPEALKGTGVAAAGIALGVLGTFILLVAAIFYPVFMRAREKSAEIMCLNNIVSIGKGMSMYLTDWNEEFPPAENWSAALLEYKRMERMLSCPKTDRRQQSYALNAMLAAMHSAGMDDPSKTVMLFESVSGKDQCGGMELLPNPARHPRGHSVLFVDLRADTIDDPLMLTWNPWPPAREILNRQDTRFGIPPRSAPVIRADPGRG